MMHSPEDPRIDRSLSGHKDSVTSVAFHPCPSSLGRTQARASRQQQQIASSAADGCLTLWNFFSNQDEVRAYK